MALTSTHMALNRFSSPNRSLDVTSLGLTKRIIEYSSRRLFWKGVPEMTSCNGTQTEGVCACARMNDEEKKQKRRGPVEFVSAGQREWEDSS